LFFFRHSAQNPIDNRQVYCAHFAYSGEKTGGASAALLLCGIALTKILYHISEQKSTELRNKRIE